MYGFALASGQPLWKRKHLEQGAVKRYQVLCDKTVPGFDIPSRSMERSVQIESYT
jgi:hypothetical protein